MAKRRVGPQVLAVLRRVARHPGCGKREAAAAAVGVAGPLASGDQAVQVSFAAGFLRDTTALQLTDTGQMALSGAAASPPPAPPGPPRPRPAAGPPDPSWRE